jgi:hypothetical protein
MAHFAQMDDDNIVLRVVVVDNRDILDEEENESEVVGVEFCKGLFGQDTNWLQTSYNRNFRGNYAGVGFKYYPLHNGFASPQPYPSWTLGKDPSNLECTECLGWSAPVPHPNDGGDYRWDEDTESWVLAEND